MCVFVCAHVCTSVGSDYGRPPDCCFAAGEKDVICNVTIVSDASAEPDEMFNLRLNPSSGQCICEPPGGPNITVTIVDMQRKFSYAFKLLHIHLQPTIHYLVIHYYYVYM